MAVTTEDLKEHARRMILAFDAAQARYGKGVSVTFTPDSETFRVVKEGRNSRSRLVLLEAKTWTEFWKRLTGEVPDATPARRPGRPHR